MVNTVQMRAPSGARDVVATLRDVTVTYDGYQTRALSRINVDIPRGVIVGVLGGKGAGKSTILKLLAGRVRAAEGTVKVFGRSPRRSSTRSRIGYLPGKIDADRSAGFFQRLFGGKRNSAGTARGAARVTQAVLGNRELLILDDPFQGLDPAEALEVKGLIRDMAGRGKSIVLSGDSLMDVKELCQEFVILHEGRLQGAGSLAELLAASAAIRFLPAVLPREMLERVLGLLRQEVLAGETAAPAVPATNSLQAPRAGSENVKAGAPRADHLLTPLTKMSESPSAPAGAKTSDPIDHQKLEELTKPKQPE